MVKKNIIDNKFLVIDFLDLKWLKNLDSGGAQKYLIDNKKDDNIIIKSEAKFKKKKDDIIRNTLWASILPENFLNIILENNNLYEVICSYPHKVYFDIDCKKIKNDINDKDFENLIINTINDFFPNSDMAISGSITDNKISFHIILNNYMIQNEKDRTYINLIVLYLKNNVHSSFDNLVYTNNRNMKIINQSKFNDERVQKIIYNDDIKKHCITCFFNTHILDLPKFEEPKEEKIADFIEIEKVNKTFDLGELPKIKLEIPTEFDINEATPNEILQLMPLNINFNHNYTHLIARFCFFNEINFNTFYEWYKQKNISEEKKKKWIHNWSKLEKFKAVQLKHITPIIIKYYPNFKKEKGQQNYENLFNISKNKIIKVETLTEDIFNNTEKFLILNTGMGSGKTHQTINYLKNKNSFIWMTPLEALAQNTQHRLQENNINCKYYNDFKNAQEKHQKMSIYDKLIICINSLPYTKDKYYKIVVIDEIETLLNKWVNNETLNNKTFLKSDCWLRFINIINNAEKVIFLDAFTSKITTNFINNLNNGDYKIIERIKEPSTRIINFKSNIYEWLKNIIDDLKTNKKLFIFYPYLKANRGLPSMQELNIIIQNETNKRGVFYNSEIDDNVLKGLSNVNETWSGFDFVITNTKITVGINFDLIHFDSVFLSIAGFNMARDILQVSYRCRNLKSNLINICYIDNKSTVDCFINDEGLVYKCNIYKLLKDDILIERKAPLKKSILFLSSKAHYTIKIKEKEVKNSLESYFKKLFDEIDINYNYDSIPKINFNDLKILNENIQNKNATLDDKIALKKFYYINQFVENADNEFLKIGWDNRYLLFFNKLNDLQNDENNIFEKIKNFNKWDSIFPEDKFLNKVKLDDNLKDEIFNNFHFKNITKLSGALAIIKNIYNTFFCKKVIISINKGSKNYISSITEETKNIYKFGLDNLKYWDNKHLKFENLKNDELNFIDLFEDI